MAGKEGAPYNNTNALKYKTKKALKQGIDDYFKNCDDRERPYTMSGLALHLGIDRNTLINYGKNELFYALVKEAKDRVQASIEENAFAGKYNSTFSIFNLKANYGWNDSPKEDEKKETPVVEVRVVDNSNLEKVLYEENEKD